MVEAHDAFIKLVTELQKLGATHVRSGELEVTLLPRRPAAVPERPAETPKQREEREAAERDRDLFWSVGG